MDAPLLLCSAQIIEQLVAQKRRKPWRRSSIAWSLICLTKILMYRAKASKGLTEIIESFSPDQQSELIERLSGQLIDWIKLETVVTLDYRKNMPQLTKTSTGFHSPGTLCRVHPDHGCFQWHSFPHPGEKWCNTWYIFGDHPKSGIQKSISPYSLKNSIPMKEINGKRPANID